MVGYVCLSTMRRYDGVIRMASTNSKPISAVCHALPENEEEGHLLFVQWGGNCYEWGVRQVCLYNGAG